MSKGKSELKCVSLFSAVEEKRERNESSNLRRNCQLGGGQSGQESLQSHEQLSHEGVYC